MVGGAHAGVRGILNIHADPSLKGWILIGVVNEAGQIVKQSGEDLIAFELTRETDYAREIQLAPGRNSITVKNTPNPATSLGDTADRVMFEWAGADATTAAPSDTPGAPKPLPTGAVASPSGKLVVIGLHDDEKAMIRAAVDKSLAGPFIVSVVDEAGNPVHDASGKAIEEEKELGRKDNSFDVTVPLGKGKNVVKVRSKETTEAAETVTLPTWDVKGAEAAEKKPFSFKPSESKTTTDGKLSADATRVDGKIELRIHAADSITGFTVDILDKDSKTVAHREYKPLPRGTNDWTDTFKAGEGTNKVTVAAIGSDAKVDLTVAAVAKLAPLASDTPAFAPSDAKSIQNGKLSAEATRVNGSIQLKVHTDSSIRGIRLEVKDKDNKEVDRREFDPLGRGLNDWSIELAAAPGENTIKVVPLGSEIGELELKVGPEAKLGALDTNPFLIPNSLTTRAIVGLEQFGASSTESQTKPFVDLFFFSPLRYKTRTVKHKPGDQSGTDNELTADIPLLSAWGNIRLSSIPEQVATIGTIPSSFVNPLAQGSLNNKLVQSFDFLAGLELSAFLSNKSYLGLIPGIKQRTEVSLVAGGGAISPLSTTREANSQIFVVPSAASPQRDLFVARYGAAAASKKYIAFVFPERDRFLRQFYGGVRFKTYYYDKGGALINRFPALLDVMLGQNEGVTGGRLKSDLTDAEGKLIGRKRSYVLRLEAFYPFPLKETSFLYLFGSAMMKVGGGGVKIDTPLILDTAQSNILVTNDDVFVAPTLQTNRDYYRLGIGVDLIDLFNRNKKQSQ